MPSGDLRDRIRRAPANTVAAIGQRIRTRAVVGVTLFTVLLTAYFVGVSAFLAGGNSGFSARIPYYVLIFAIAFVVGMQVLDDRHRPGRYVLVAVAGLSVGIFVLVAVASEGVIYAIRNPGDVLASQVFVYFVAAALVCTGVGMWAVRHWREFTSR